MKFPVLSAGTYLNIAATASGHNMDTVVLWRVYSAFVTFYCWLLYEARHFSE